MAARRELIEGESSELTERQKTRTVTIALPLDVYRRVRNEAATRGVSMQAVFHEILTAGSKNMHDPLKDGEER